MNQYILVEFFVDNKNNVRMLNISGKGVNTLVHKACCKEEAEQVAQTLNDALERSAFDGEDD